MEVKKITKEFFDDAVNLSMYAFQYELSPERKEKVMKGMESHHILGIFDGNQLASKLHIRPYEVFQHGRKVKMGGIASVASYPEYRRQGHIKALMTQALEVMRDQGQVLSFLSPFSIDFYRKFGWELVAEQALLTIKKADLSFRHETKVGTVKRLGKRAWHQDLQVIYENYAREVSGMLVRDELWWKDSVIQDQVVAIYYSEDHVPEGYILYQVENAKMTVEEFIVLTPQARKELWNFICQHDSMVDQTTITISTFEPLPYMMKNPRIKQEIKPNFMGRIVDVDSYIKQYPWNFEVDEPNFLNVHDEFAPWNHGTYQISQDFTGKIESKDDGLLLSINSLSALLLGYKTVEELVAIGAILGKSREIEILQRIVPKQCTYFPDFF